MKTTWQLALSRAGLVACFAAGLTALVSCGGDQAAHGSSDADGSAPPDASGARDVASEASTPAGDASADAKSDSDGGCAVLSAHAFAGQARSTGFAGPPTAYDGLYGVPCTTAADCVPSCVDAGGTSASCSSGSLCLPDICPDGGDGCPSCLPPTYWLEVTGALGRPDSGAVGNPADDNQAFDNGYNDTLELTGFGLSVPSSATIRGIAFDVDREANDLQATDSSVRALHGGSPTGADHASSSPWPTAFTTVRYGGPGDTWGGVWTPADVTASGFGIAITPQYLGTGNDHVDIDSVAATVYYTTPSCP